MASRDEETIGGLAAAAQAAAWREGLDAVVDKARQAVDSLIASRGNQGDGQLQGFFAEHWHAHSLEVDAWKKGLHGVFVEVPSSTLRASPDIIIRQGDGPQLFAQLKYYKTAGETTSQLWNPKYSSTQFKVVPADQTAEVLERSARQAATGTRAHVRDAAQHSVDHATDRVSAGGAESRPLSRHESGDLTRQARQGEDVMGQLGTLSAEELGKRVAIGGAVAAGIGAALAFAPHAAKAFSAWRKGDPELAKALLTEGGSKAATAGGWAGLQGAMATALVETARSGALGPALADLSPGAVGAIAVVIVQSIRDGQALYNGEITAVEFGQRCATTSAVAAGSVAGAAIGQALIPIPVLGSLIGSVVGGLVARGGIAALEWTIEKMRTVLGPVLDYVGETLFGWQALEEAQRLSLAIDNELGDARLAIVAVRRQQFEVFASLRLHEIDIPALRSTNDAHEAELDALEASLKRRDSQPMCSPTKVGKVIR